MLIMYRVAMTEQAQQDLESHLNDIDCWLTIEDVLNRDDVRQGIFEVLNI